MSRKRQHEELQLSISDQRQLKSDLSIKNKVRRQKTGVLLDQSPEPINSINLGNTMNVNVPNTRIYETQLNAMPQDNLLTRKRKSQTQTQCSCCVPNSNNVVDLSGEPQSKRVCNRKKTSSRLSKNSQEVFGTKTTSTPMSPPILLNRPVSRVSRAQLPCSISSSLSTNTLSSPEVNMLPSDSSEFSTRSQLHSQLPCTQDSSGYSRASSASLQYDLTTLNPPSQVSPTTLTSINSTRRQPSSQISERTLNLTNSDQDNMHEGLDSISSDSESSSEEDCHDGVQDINDLGGNFACHLANMPAHQGIDINKLNFQYAEPISTPISSQVSSKLKKKIWRNTYFDIASLLPRAPAAQPGQFSLQLGSKSQINLVPSVQTRKIYTIEAWTAAFIRFAAIYTERYTTEAPQLFKYMEIVRDLAFKKPGNAWQIYDQQFRSLRENVPIPWGRLHTEFWVMSSTSSQSRPRARQFSQKQNFRSNNQSSSSTDKSYRFLENTCWTYNRRGYCRKFECSFQHRCGFCRGNHNATVCPTPLSRTSNTQTTTSKLTQSSGGKAPTNTTQSTGAK